MQTAASDIEVMNVKWPGMCVGVFSGVSCEDVWVWLLFGV